MNRRRFSAFLAAAFTAAALPAPGGEAGANAAGDPGKDVIASVHVTVYYGTDGDPAAAGQHAAEVSKEVEKRLAADPRLKFAKYRQLGKDVKPLYRSYENWAQPFSNSDEVLIRFEAQSQIVKETVRLDLELWLSHKKILKTVAPAVISKPLLVLGPQWRGGRLILAIELASAPSKP